MKLAEDWLLADAYASTVGLRQVVDGPPVPTPNRKQLDSWRKAHAPALKAFPDVGRAIKQGEDWLDRARTIGAQASNTEARQQAQALQRFVTDPEAFWGSITGRGTDRAMREIKDVIGTVRRSGDVEALAGLKSSFWEHLLVDAFSKKGAEFNTPELAMASIRKVLGSPQLRKAATDLFGPEHVKMLEYAARTQRAVTQSASIPSGVRAQALQGASEQMKKFATQASVFSVILGPVRRTFKVSKALDDFVRRMDVQQIGALFVESMRNPALLRDLLQLDPSIAVTNRITNRMSTNIPTLFPRVPAAAEHEEEREKRFKREDEPANRAITSPPTALFSRPRNAALGRFG